MDVEAAWKEMLEAGKFVLREAPTECPMCNRIIGSGDFFTEWEGLKGLDLKPASICEQCSPRIPERTEQKWPSRVGVVLLPQHQNVPIYKLPGRVRARLNETLALFKILKESGKL